MADPAARARIGPGRPSSGARERILSAAAEVLKADGYAGLTMAKVAARSGQNKALISYHFGSKQGLVAAVATDVSDELTREVLGELGEPATALELVRGIVDGLWHVLERDEGIARVYFDLAAQSIVDPDVSDVMREMRAGFRTILAAQLSAVEDRPRPAAIDAVAVLLIAGLEGLALERLDRGETGELQRARELFIRTAPATIQAA